MAITIIDESKLLEAIEKDIQAQIADSMDAVIEKAKSDLEAALRKELAGSALKLLSFYQIERQKQDIVITVKG